jgi:hypothetical protein
MSIGRFGVVFLVLGISAGLARADGLFYTLPQDGTWATYDFKGSATVSGQSVDVKGTLRVASVGQVTERKQPCRWIEIEFKREVSFEGQAEQSSETYKVLIPEKYLVKGQTPLDHILRAWRDGPGGQPIKFTVSKTSPDSPLPVLLSGPWKDAKPLAPAAVASKLGNVPCEGIEGTLELKRSRLVKCPMESRLHANSPFGLVTGNWTIADPALPMKWNLTLSGTGEGATSKMPNAK